MSATSTVRARNGATNARKWVVAIAGLMTAIATLIGSLYAAREQFASAAAEGRQPVESTGDRDKSVIPTGNSVPQKPIRSQPHARAKAFPLDEYIDRNVHRVAGSLNVAVAIQGLPALSSVPAAMRRALINRGMADLPLFKEKFRQDGTAQRLFGGSAALAGDLQLREFVDSVLLAEFRFVGPPQAVEGGLYIREAVLEVHAIDPSSGEVREVLEIRQKGGGASAEQSSENALTRLEQEVEDNISGWIWV